MLSFLTPAAKAVYPQRIWWFVLGLAPFFLLVLCLSALGRNANLAGGFAGRRLSLVAVFWFVFIRFVDGCRYIATVLCTLLAFTTSTSVRTEPQATSAAPEGKKKCDRVFRKEAFLAASAWWALQNKDLRIGRHVFFSVRRLLGFCQVVAQVRLCTSELCRNMLSLLIESIKREHGPVHSPVVVHRRWQQNEPKKQPTPNTTHPRIGRHVQPMGIERPSSALLRDVLARSKKWSVSCHRLLQTLGSRTSSVVCRKEHRIELVHTARPL